MYDPGHDHFQLTKYFVILLNYMSDKLHKTKGIVLKTIKYGETSVIVSIYTELFGIQSYLVNGVRTSGKKGSPKAILLQPSAILDLVVYHNELKQLNRIKEFKWGFLYQTVLTEVPKNAVALFMVELLTKCLKQPEANQELYNFAEDVFIQLDSGHPSVVANLPLFFAVHLSHFFGFRMDDNYNDEKLYLDLQEGSFTEVQPRHPHFLEGQQAATTSQILKVMQPSELSGIKLNHDFRRNLLNAFETFYSLHIAEFGKLKTLPVLRELMR